MMHPTLLTIPVLALILTLATAGAALADSPAWEIAEGGTWRHIREVEDSTETPA